jgi:hypothetical protein
VPPLPDQAVVTNLVDVVDQEKPAHHGVTGELSSARKLTCRTLHANARLCHPLV